jgi:phospholipid-binding lipoprotein MlaA
MSQTGGLRVTRRKPAIQVSGFVALSALVVAMQATPVRAQSDASSETQTFAQAAQPVRPDGAGTLRAEPAVPFRNPKDPFEPFNRKIYAFNDAIDNAVLKPVATAYRDYVPEVVRAGVGNFLGNFSDAWSTVNHLLQGKVQTGMEMFMRVAVNSVLGLGGVLDVSSEMGLERRDEDFGQTLGWWGMPAGPYLVWPLLGPSSVRETVAMPLDRGVGPGLVINDMGATIGLALIGVVDTRAGLLRASRLLGDVALDPYVFVRDAYLARRRNLVWDGNPPDEDQEPAKKSAVPRDGAVALGGAARDADQADTASVARVSDTTSPSQPEDFTRGRHTCVGDCSVAALAHRPSRWQLMGEMRSAGSTGSPIARF